MLSMYKPNEKITSPQAPHQNFTCPQWLLAAFGRPGRCEFLSYLNIDQSHRYGRPQAACREPAGSYDKTTRTAICFEHKMQYLLIRAPYTRIVVFCHISNIPPMISQSQISCNTPRFIYSSNICELECGTWYHHPRRLQCVLSRNLRIFKVATWHLSMPSQSKN